MNKDGGASIREYLSRDHARLDDALTRGDYEQFREGLLWHIGVEEKILLPMASGLPIAERIHLDHGALSALLVPTPTPAILTAIRTILSNHNPLEEGPGGLYEHCEKISGENKDLILAKIQQTPRVRVAQHVDNRTSMDSARYALRRAGYSIDL
jgi:hypothetical protein